MTCAVAVKELVKAFGPRKAVSKVSFELPEGAFLSVFGPNGAGKTTLLRMLATLERPTSGSVTLAGADAFQDPETARASLGMVSHAPMLYPDLTAEENLVFFGRLYGVEDPKRRAVQLLDHVGLKHRRKDLVRTFSRGMTQRASIARALMNDPAVLLLDEPYSGLDPAAAEALDGLLESIRPGRTFVMVGHDFSRGMALATHVLVMDRGSAVFFGPAQDCDLHMVRSMCGLGESAGKGGGA